MEKVKYFAINLLISFIITVLLLAVSSAIFAYTSIDDRHLQTFVFGIILLSNLVGSTLLSRKIKEKGLIYGGIFGILYCFSLYLLTSLLFNNFVVSNTLFIYLAISFISGIIGGVIGVNI